MFHMLGRFVFTSSFSRRSSPGFSTGSNRFGFCCCERGLLNVSIISIPIHPSIIRNSNATSAARSPHASVRSGHRSLATFRNASYGSVLPNHMALGTRRYPSPPPHPSRSAFFHFAGPERMSWRPPAPKARFKRPPHRAHLGTAVTRGKNVA